ncbi:hypothetical protein DY240_31090 [Jiangella rhizosphaerae]|uniref:Uncharacterized protein n=1 Tax=Jiangella rhizosphaerae TaxID=2293569 RepID=A0A418KFZ7_9ACTN|nr:hypothetical protein [Jiangella rhizosphaerae]RIQ10834.1 hypothetical protein DY240_31090 [Jiangella rhizosphaerae]
MAARYDERTLSNTKLTYLYDPGSRPVTFEVDGYRFGLALGMDAHFPELFASYMRLVVNGVLVSYETGGVPGRETVATEVREDAIGPVVTVPRSAGRRPPGRPARSAAGSARRRRRARVR